MVLYFTVNFCQRNKPNNHIVKCAKDIVKIWIKTDSNGFNMPILSLDKVYKDVHKLSKGYSINGKERMFTTTWQYHIRFRAFVGKDASDKFIKFKNIFKNFFPYVHFEEDSLFKTEFGIEIDDLTDLERYDIFYR